MNTTQDAWSAFHTGALTKEYETDRMFAEAACEHVFKAWTGNPMVNRCEKCGSWHYTDKR